MEGTIKEKQYLSETGMYIFQSDIGRGEAKLKDGLEVDVSIIKEGNQYPVIVPNGSITKTDGKDHVFILKTRKGVLGDEYYVEMKSIKVEESDDFRSGISGNVFPEDNIITYSTKALSDGTQVKLR